MAHNSNKLTKLDGQQNEIVSGPLIHRVGEPYYSYYVYEYAGVDAETGKEMFYLNDGTENARKTTTNISEANKTIVGKHQASIEGGLTNNLKWKFIDLGFTFTYSLGGDALTTPLGSTPMAVHIYTVVPYRHTTTSQRCGPARATRMPHCLNLNMEA